MPKVRRQDVKSFIPMPHLIVRPLIVRLARLDSDAEWVAQRGVRARARE